VSVIKRAALDALVGLIGGTAGAGYADAAVPSLAQKVYPYVRDVGANEQTPYLALVAQGFTLNLRNPIDVGAPSGGLQMTQLGRFEGRVQIRLGAASDPERESLEDAVLGVFLAPEDSPGVVKLTTAAVDVGAQLSVMPAKCVYELTDDDWRDERVFEKKRFVFVNLRLTYPALVMRSGVYTLQHLYVRLSQDLGNTAGAAPFDQDEIHADGSVTTAQGA